MESLLKIGIATYKNKRDKFLLIVSSNSGEEIFYIFKLKDIKTFEREYGSGTPGCCQSIWLNITLHKNNDSYCFNDNDCSYNFGNIEEQIQEAQESIESE
jgi:hypothetical protein